MSEKTDWEKSIEEDKIAEELGWECPMDFDSCGRHCKFWRLHNPRNRCVHKEEFIKENSLKFGTIWKNFVKDRYGFDLKIKPDWAPEKSESLCMDESQSSYCFEFFEWLKEKGLIK